MWTARSYVDGKVLDIDFLRDVAERGSQPARSAFAGAFVAWSRLDELEDLLAQIPIYPEAQHDDLLLGFTAQATAWRWFMGEAEKRGDAYLRSLAATKLVLFCGRTILAHNRILYPFHKWLMHSVKNAPDQPADFVAKAEALLAEPSFEASEQLFDDVGAWRPWAVTTGDWASRFIRDSEWNWRDRPAPIDDA